MASAVRLHGLSAGYPGEPDVLVGLDLEVPEGGAVAVLGPSGGGKTTLLKVVAGLVAPTTGIVEVLGARLPARPQRGHVGYIPQRLGLVRHASALQNVLQGALHETPTWRSLLRRPAPDVLARGREALDAVGLATKHDVPVHRLSGGQQRRVAIARALVQRPRLLLADEFLGELDPKTVDAVAASIRLLQEQGTTLLMVEHHPEHAVRVADRVLSLEHGVLEEVVPSAHGLEVHA